MYGVEAHQHFDSMIVLCWNIHNITECYNNYIVRFIIDWLVENQLRRTFRRFMVDGVCVSYCRYTSSYGVVREGPCT
jgi:hypothetical protein